MMRGLMLALGLVLVSVSAHAQADEPACKVYTTRAMRDPHYVVDVPTDRALCSRAVAYGTARQGAESRRRQICRRSASRKAYRCTDVWRWPNSIRIRKRP